MAVGGNGFFEGFFGSNVRRSVEDWDVWLHGQLASISGGIAGASAGLSLGGAQVQQEIQAELEGDDIGLAGYAVAPALIAIASLGKIANGVQLGSRIGELSVAAERRAEWRNNVLAPQNRHEQDERTQRIRGRIQRNLPLVQQELEGENRIHQLEQQIAALRARVRLNLFDIQTRLELRRFELEKVRIEGDLRYIRELLAQEAEI